MLTRPSSFTLVAFAAAIAIACKKNPPPPAPTPPTPAEADTFAAAYVRAKAPCDVTKMVALVDLDLIIARSVQGTHYSSGMVAAMRRGLDPQQMLCSNVLGANPTIRHLRTQTVDGSPQPLFRLLGDGGFTYERLELDKRADTVVAVDILNYAGGEPHSVVFRNVLASLENNDRNVTGLIKQMNKHRADGKFREAYDTFKVLPEALRTSRELMVIELQIATSIDEPTAIEALDRFTKAYPNHPSMLITEINMQLLHKRHDKALAAIERLDRNLGGDPYLDVMRADSFLAMGKLDDAIATAKRATTREPTLTDAWWMLLTVQTASKRFADAPATLSALSKLAKVDRASLEVDDRFKILVASAEFAAWERDAPK